MPTGDGHGHGHRHGPGPGHGPGHGHGPGPGPGPGPGHEHEHGSGSGHAHEERRGLREDLARGAGRDKILFVDAPSGVAGDMLVAALLDLGVPRRAIEEALADVPMRGYRVDVSDVVRSSIAARSFRVDVDPGQPERSWREIRELLERAELGEGVRSRALLAFGRLAEAEAKIHGVTVDDVHFHEVGAVDSIVDVVAVAAALDHLGARLVASPLPLGRGSTMSRHGRIPLPAPATVLCLEGVPTYDGGVDVELVTPTGAALVGALAEEFARWPRMRPERVGFGAGTRELADRPNVVRLVLGAPEPLERTSSSTAAFSIIETNVDDTTGEVVAWALGRALEAGALDAWATPISMKKGRPATMISILCRSAQTDELARLLFAETTTIGVRIRPCDRIERPRRLVEVTTPYGAITVKVSDGDGLPVNAAPEYESCRRAAAAHGVPLKHVYGAALAALRK